MNFYMYMYKPLERARIRNFDALIPANAMLTAGVLNLNLQNVHNGHGQQEKHGQRDPLQCLIELYLVLEACCCVRQLWQRWLESRHLSVRRVAGAKCIAILVDVLATLGRHRASQSMWLYSRTARRCRLPYVIDIRLLHWHIRWNGHTHNKELVARDRLQLVFLLQYDVYGDTGIR